MRRWLSSKLRRQRHGAVAVPWPLMRTASARAAVTRSKSVPLRGGGDAAHLVDGIGVHVLELVGEHVGLHEDRSWMAVLLIVFGGDSASATWTGSAVRRRVKHADAEAHVKEGRTKLSCGRAGGRAADDADGRSPSASKHDCLFPCDKLGIDSAHLFFSFRYGNPKLVGQFGPRRRRAFARRAGRRWWHRSCRRRWWPPECRRASGHDGQCSESPAGQGVERTGTLITGSVVCAATARSAGGRHRRHRR